MKLKLTIILFLILTAFTTFDIAPNPISANGIYTTEDCKIRMESEIVNVELFKEYSVVECTFEMVNYGKGLSLEVGFPVMDFHHYSVAGYTENDKSNFEIFVDNELLTSDDIKVPTEMDSIYTEFMKVHKSQKEHQNKIDSIYNLNNVEHRKDGSLLFPKGVDYQTISKQIDSINRLYWNKTGLSGDLIGEFYNLAGEGKYPWYVWNVEFQESEKKTIKVKYKLPSGVAYRTKYRYFKYILNTGAGWYRDIGKADIFIHLNDIDLKYIEKIEPNGYSIDKQNKIVKWNLENIEPTEKDNIYLQYSLPKETRKHKRWKKKSDRKYGN